MSRADLEFARAVAIVASEKYGIEEEEAFDWVVASVEDLRNCAVEDAAEIIADEIELFYLAGLEEEE